MSGDRVRVLYVNHVTRISGAERSMLDLIDHLPPRYEPLAAVAPGELVEPLASREIETCILDELTLSFRLSLRTTPRGLAWIPRTARRLRRFASTHEVDLLHANDTRSGFPAGLAARVGGPPAIVHVRDRLPDGRLGRAAGALTSRTADAVLSNSEFVAEGFGGARSRLSVVPNAVDTERFDPQRYDRAAERARLGLAEDEDAIAIVGHLTPLKAQDDAVRMLAHLRGRERPVRLLIVGSVKFTGPGTAEDNVGFERRLRELVADLDLADRVELLGEREDVAAVLAASDVLVTPSWREGFGRVVLEGMAMELPVVATDVGGPAEIVRPGEDGVLLPPRAPERWAEAVADLLDGPDRGKGMGRTARERVRREYGIDRYVAGVTGIYESLLGP